MSQPQSTLSAPVDPSGTLSEWTGGSTTLAWMSRKAGPAGLHSDRWDFGFMGRFVS